MKLEQLRVLILTDVTRVEVIRGVYYGSPNLYYKSIAITLMIMDKRRSFMGRVLITIVIVVLFGLVIYARVGGYTYMLVEKLRTVTPLELQIVLVSFIFVVSPLYYAWRYKYLNSVYEETGAAMQQKYQLSDQKIGWYIKFSKAINKLDYGENIFVWIILAIALLGLVIAKAVTNFI